MITALSSIESGKVTFDNRDKFESELKNLMDGRYEWTIKRIFRKATRNQFGWMFAAVYKEFIIGATNAGWEIPGNNERERIEYIDAFCKTMFCSIEILNKNTCEYVKIPDLKRKFDTVSATAYIEKIRDHSMEFFGHYIEDPKKVT